eukprot:5006647-Prymnesium_polylepis.1
MAARGGRDAGARFAVGWSGALVRRRCSLLSAPSGARWGLCCGGPQCVAAFVDRDRLLSMSA